MHAKGVSGFGSHSDGEAHAHTAETLQAAARVPGAAHKTLRELHV